MATATRKPSLPSFSTRPSPTIVDRILGVCDAIYRFLASLKLAVFTLGTLSATLAYATFFESWYGGTAAQEWVYRSPGFSLLLGFLGTNILCAALIRFPWKKRQTGFVVTHAGLLVVLAGSWWSFKTADEAQVGMLEGQKMHELYRRDDAAFRIRKIDRETGQPEREFGEFELPFHPGTFPWGKGYSQWFDVSGWPAQLMSLRKLPGAAEVVISKPKDPFQVTVKGFLPASVRATVGVEDAAGDPMLKLRPRFKGPGMPRLNDLFEDGEERWFVTDHRFNRVVKTQFPAQFVFNSTEKPEVVEDFLHPPRWREPEGAVRVRYHDRKGQVRTYDWPLDEQTGQSVGLPESDITITLEKIVGLPTDEIPVRVNGRTRTLARVLGEPAIPLAQFRVRERDGKAAEYYAWGSLPSIPNLLPGRDDDPSQAAPPLVQLNYFIPPVLGPKGEGLTGVVEVLGTKEGALHYRVFGRKANELSELRQTGALKKGEQIIAFGGNPNLPMTLMFEVEDYLTAGALKEICEPLALPAGKKGEGVGACLVALTIEDSTQEIWVQGSFTLDKSWQRVTFPSGVYEVALDADRKPLDFQLTLEDFQRGFDPGTEQPSRFASTVLLTDEQQGTKDQRITISMNNPLTHRGYTFYQQEYRPEFDTKTGQTTGRFISTLQVATDPGQPVKYVGCYLVILGAFLQFYMRAGIFTDGGKKERERAAAKASARAARDGEPSSNEDPGNSVTDVSEAEEVL